MEREKPDLMDNNTKSVQELEQAISALSIQENEQEKFPAFRDNPATHIIFYDLETTIPPTDIIEFGAIVLHKTSLHQVETFSTLLHSTNITQDSVKANGITGDMVQGKPRFEDIADKIFSLLDGKIWAGHNITTFDNPQIRKQFEKLGKTPPRCAGVVDTLFLLRKLFQDRTTDFKMNTLGAYFELGEEKHRAFDDVLMTIEVFKRCALTLLLEDHVGPKKVTSTPKKKTPAVKKSSTSTPMKDEASSTNTQATPQKIEQNVLSSTATPDKPTRNNTPAKHRQSTGTYNNNTHNFVYNEVTVKQLQDAMDGSKLIWISYSAGGNPTVPRAIAPLRWVEHPRKFLAVCQQSHTEKNFCSDKVLEIRDTQWTVSMSTTTKSQT